MTNDRIQEHLDLANSKNLEYLEQFELSENVIRVKGYDNLQELNRFDKLGYKRYVETFYLISENPILSEVPNFIGFVLDLKRDLHWYVNPKYRGKGYLTRALEDSILYDIPRLNFYGEEMNKIEITIKKDNIESQKVALNLGFENIGQTNKYNSYDDELWVLKDYKYEY
jgi:RimJ/RimL family protein N-acetyltransferase